MPIDRNTEETLLADYVVSVVRDRASGAAEDECLRNYPHDVYFIGNLRSVQTAMRSIGGSGGQIELQAKIAPFAFGGQVRLFPVGNELRVAIKVSWAVYYRVLPTLEQQRVHLQQRFETAEAASASALRKSDPFALA
jgi:hypothetical protein